ncbi:MAG: hypothetical protein Q7R99_02775 [bacterium]|nr:hypothetical protein [bacterium]
MKRFKLLATLSVVLALLLTSTMAFAISTQQMVQIDQITAVQNYSTIIAAPVADKDVGQMVASINEKNANSVVFKVDATLKKDVTVQKSMVLDFSQVVSASPPQAQLVSSHIYSVLMMEKSVVVESTPIARTQVATIKQPMMVAGMGYNHQIDVFAVTAKNAGLSGIDQMKMAAVLPNQTSKHGESTAFLDVAIMASNVTHATYRLEAEVVGTIKNYGMAQLKGSTYGGSIAQGTIFST